MEIFTEEGLSYTEFRKLQHLTNDSKLTKKLNEVIRAYYDLLYLPEDYNEVDDSGESQQSHLKTFSLAAMGLIQDDQGDNTYTDMSQNKVLTGAQEFWFNYMHKKRKFTTLWMSHAILLMVCTVAIQVFNMWSRVRTHDEHKYDGCTVHYVDSTGKDSIAHLPITYIFGLHPSFVLHDAATAIILIIFVSVFDGLKPAGYGRTEAFRWLRNMRHLAFTTILVLTLCLLKSLASEFIMFVPNERYPNFKTGLLDLRPDADEFIRRITFYEAMEMLGKVANGIACTLLMDVPVPATWWVPSLAIITFAQLVYYANTMLFRLSSEPRYAILVIITAGMVPVSIALSHWSHFQNEVLSFILAKNLDELDKKKKARLSFLKVDIKKKVGGLAVSLRRPFDSLLENMVDRHEGEAKRGYHAGTHKDRDSSILIQTQDNDVQWNSTPGGGVGAANIDGSKDGKTGHSKQAQSPPEEPHNAKEDTILGKVFKQKCALEFKMLEIKRVAEDLSLMYMIDEQRVPRANHRALVTAQALPDVVNGLLISSYMPLRWALGDRNHPRDLVVRQYHREDGALVMLCLEGMMEFVFEPSALGVVSDDSVDRGDKVGTERDRDGTGTGNENGAECEPPFRFCDTLTTMAMDRILLWVCHQCAIKSSQSGSKGVAVNTGASKGRFEREGKQPLRPRLFTVNFSLRCSKEVLQRDPRLYKAEPILYPWDPTTQFPQRDPGETKLDGNWDYTADYLITMRVESHTCTGTGTDAGTGIGSDGSPGIGSSNGVKEDRLHESLSAFNAQCLSALTGGGAHFGPLSAADKGASSTCGIGDTGEGKRPSKDRTANHACWFNFGVTRAHLPESARDDGKCGQISREIQHLPLWDDPNCENCLKPSLQSTGTATGAASDTRSSAPERLPNSEGHLRLCIVSDDNDTQETLSEIITTAGLKKFILLKETPKEENVSDLTELVDVLVVADRNLCLHLRQHGYDGPLILITESGYYIGRSLIRLPDLIIHMPLSSYALHLLGHWLRRLSDGEKSILLYEPVVKSMEPQPQAEDRKYREHITRFWRRANVLWKDTQLNSVWNVISFPWRLMKLFLELCWRIFIILCFLEANMARSLRRLYGSIHRTFLEHGLDSCSHSESSCHQYHLNRSYQQIYGEPRPREVPDKGGVLIRPILSARFAFDIESTKWGNGVSFEYLSSEFDFRDMGIKFNCEDLEMSFQHWMDEGRFQWDTPRHHIKTILCIAYLVTIILLHPIPETWLSASEIFIYILMIMVINRIFLRRTAQRFINFMTKRLGTPHFYNLEWGFYGLFLYDAWDFIMTLLYLADYTSGYRLTKAVPFLEGFIATEVIMEQMTRRGFNYIFISIFAHQVMRVPLEPGPVYADLVTFIMVRAFFVGVLFTIYMGHINADISLHYREMIPNIYLCYGVCVGIILSYITYYHTRADKIEYQLWRRLDFNLRYLKKFSKHLEGELGLKLEEISTQMTDMNKEFYHLVALSANVIHSEFLAEHSLFTKSFLEFENIHMVLRRRAAIARLVEKATSLSSSDADESDYHGANKASDPFQCMYPVREVSKWCERLLSPDYKRNFSISVLLKVEPSLCAIRIHKNLFKLMITRALSTVSKEAKRGDQKLVYQVLVRISSLETFIERDKFNARYANYDEDGGADGVTIGGRAKSKFLTKKQLVVEVLHGSRAHGDTVEESISPVYDGDPTQSDRDTDRASRSFQDGDDIEGDGDTYLWESCQHIMNAGRLYCGNKARKYICTEGLCGKAHWPYNRRTMFSLSYQQLPLAAKIASAMKSQALYLSKDRFCRGPAPASSLSLRDEGRDTTGTAFATAAGEGSSVVSSSPSSDTQSTLSSSGRGGGIVKAVETSADSTSRRVSGSMNLSTISNIFHLLVSSKQLQFYRNSHVNLSAYNTWMSSFTALGDSENTKYYSAYSRHSLQTIVINLAKNPIFHYVSRLTKHGWKVKLVEATNLVDGDVDMALFEEASCVFLFHNSAAGLHPAYKHVVTGAMERMYVSGNLRRLIGVDMAGVETHDATSSFSAASQTVPGVGGPPDYALRVKRVLYPAPKDTSSDVAGAVVDFRVDAEALRLPHMLNALTQEVAREILKSLLDCYNDGNG